MRRLAILLSNLLLAALPLVASAQSPVPDGLQQYLFPAPGLGFAPQDRLFVIYEQQCGRPELDTSRAPTIIQQGRTIAVDIYLVAVPGVVCPAVAAPGVPVYFEVGALPKGSYSILRRLHVRQPAEPDPVQVSQQTVPLQVGDTPHRAVSGAWFDPEDPGTGLFIAVVPTPAGEPFPGPPQVAMYLAELTGSNQPSWATGLGQFDNGVLRASITRGGQTRADYVAEFRYLGCGRARLSEVGSPGSFVDLIQLTRIDGVPDCLPEGE